MGVCVKGCEFGKQKKIKIKIDVQNCRFCPNQNCAINVDWDERIIFLSDKIRIFSEYFYQIYDILHFFASDFHRKLDYSSKTQQKTQTNTYITYLVVCFIWFQKFNDVFAQFKHPFPEVVGNFFHMVLFFQLYIIINNHR